MFDSMAVTTDFSEASRAALGPAGTLAKQLGARLFLVHVARDPAEFFPWQAQKKTQYEAEARRPNLENLLAALVRSEPAFAGLKVTCRVLHGRGAEAITDFQRQEGINLLVLASHGHTGARQFLLGSFASRVLQLAACPVLFLRADDPDQKPLLARPFAPRRILVPHDFSPAAVDCLSLARQLATVLGAKLRLLHVIDTSRDVESASTAADTEEYFASLHSECLTRLRQLGAPQETKVATEAHVRSGHPALEIIKEAEAYPADLIVMASRGLTLPDRISLGSVTEKIIHRAPCPVLVVKGTSGPAGASPP